MKRIIAAVVLTLLAGTGFAAYFATDHSHTDGIVDSHSGGTDSMGCHTNHKTGDYHCH